MTDCGGRRPGDGGADTGGREIRRGLVSLDHVPARVDQVAAVCDRFELTLRERTRDAGYIARWRLVLFEALTNAIRHGVRGPGADVSVSWWTTPNTVVLEVTNAGPGPDAALLRAPALPANPFEEAGRGLYLIRSNVDDWTHRIVDGRFTLRMVRRLPTFVGLHEEHGERG